MLGAGEIFLYLLLDLVIIICAARLFGALARAVGQPAVIGEIVAGILLGSSVLGRIFPSVNWGIFPRELFLNARGEPITLSLPQALFPAQVPLKSFAEVGLIFFMFLVGLELDAKLMRQEGRRAALISLSGIIAPLGLGLVIGTFLIGVNNAGSFAAAEHGAKVPPATFSFALFLGAAMCITAFPVLARILVETGLYKLPVGTVALCAAAVDDAIAWLLLAGVVGLTRSGSAAAALPVFLLAAAYVVIMFTVVRALLARLAKRYDALGRLTVDQVAVVLAGVLASAWATERIGIHSIFGAFVFGVVMPKRSGMTRELTDKIEDFTVIVLLPIFFTYSGLRTNLFSLNSTSLLGWTLLILAVAVVGKFAGCGIVARLTGSSRRDAIVLGALMNTRGLTELVILTVGLQLGVLSDRTFAMMVIMALVTTAIAAPIVNRLVSRDELVRALVERPAAASATVAGATAAPAAAPATRVLVALGNPANAPAIIDAAIRLIGARRPAELLLTRLIPTTRAPEFRTGLLEEEREVEAAIASMRPLVDQAAAAGVAARPVSFISDDVGPDLARIAADQGCATMILGWHRASLPRHVIQALVHRVFTLAPGDVTVFVDREGHGIRAADGAARPVVVVLNGSPHDAAAERLGLGLAESLGTTITLVGYVGADYGVTNEPETLVDRARELEQRGGITVTPIFAERDGFDIALGEMAGAPVAVVPVGGDWQLDEDFGSTATRLVESADCSVLVVRAAGMVDPTSSVARPQREAVAAGD